MQVKQYKQITAIIPKGKGMPLLKSLKEDKQIISANLNFARGIGKMTPLKFRGVGEQTEKEIVSVIVCGEDSEDIYQYIYEKSGINNPHAGILYMNCLGAANEFALPDDLEEEK